MVLTWTYSVELKFLIWQMSSPIVISLTSAALVPKFLPTTVNIVLPDKGPAIGKIYNKYKYDSVYNLITDWVLLPKDAEFSFMLCVKYLDQKSLVTYCHICLFTIMYWFLYNYVTFCVLCYI